MIAEKVPLCSVVPFCFHTFIAMQDETICYGIYDPTYRVEFLQSLQLAEEIQRALTLLGIDRDLERQEIVHSMTGVKCSAALV